MHEYGDEIAHDFRRIYGVSSESIGTSKLSYNEAFSLVKCLLSWETTSLLYCAYHKIDKPYSTEAVLLTAVHNRIVDSIPVGKNNKQAKEKAKLDFPKKKEEKKKSTKKQMTKAEAAKRFASVKIAEE